MDTLIYYLTDIWNSLVSVFRSIGLIDWLDIIFLAIILYWLIKLVRETRAEQLIKGVVVLAAVLFILNQFGFKAMGVISQMVMNVGLIAFIVMFQPELRRALEKVGRSKVMQPLALFDTSLPETQGKESLAVEQIVLACEKLSRTATGALIVIERQTRLGEQIETGTILNAIPSEELFRNIFFPNTPLHDGAVIIRNGMIYAAGCFLPKPSKEELINKELGSRHRAAIGMSEVSDAIIIVVSEETGMISIAENGTLERGFDREKLYKYLSKKLLLDTPDQRKNRERRKSSKGKQAAGRTEEGGDRK
ncbi:MAG: diadenylate cyclase CdaA [Ruminiclostridium sp.]|nr:diadenylate cyclase CdaA [Ruminiclostridium sp.]